MNQKQRFMSPQPGHLGKQLLSVDFEKEAPAQIHQVVLQDEPELKAAPNNNNLMGFQKMVKAAG